MSPQLIEAMMVIISAILSNIGQISFRHDVVSAKDVKIYTDFSKNISISIWTAYRLSLIHI